MRDNLIRRLIACLIIGTLSAIAALAVAYLPITGVAVDKINWSFYDALYHTRKAIPRDQSSVAMVLVDQKSLDSVAELSRQGWPWPRVTWAMIARHLERCGAKAVAFDILLTEISARGDEDDQQLADALDELKVPVLFAKVSKDKPIIIKPQKPILTGWADVTDQSIDVVYREYFPRRHDEDSLALAAMKAAGWKSKIDPAQPFLLHYHGPRLFTKDQPTYPSVSAWAVISDAVKKQGAAKLIDPAVFKDKIVLVGFTAAGLNDLKSTPIEGQFPGVAIHATAIDNMIQGQQVRFAPRGLRWTLSVTLSFLAALGTVLPKRTSLKVIWCLGCVVTIPLISYLLFHGETIRWLPIAATMLSIILSIVLGLVWSYQVETKQARFFLRALRQCVSPGIVQQLSDNPEQLTVGGRAVELTVMFTDLQGFTEMTERLQERIEPVLNTYLKEMSEEVLKTDGTLDKYIGDAIMTFWNAPVDQPDHALRACSAALAISRRDRELDPLLREMGSDEIVTRIGLHSGRMIVGFTGSEKKLNYTAIGDGVNLAARLEPANKLYGTRILASDAVYQQARNVFLFRKVDVLRVKGKHEPMPVHELVARQDDASDDTRRIVHLYNEAYDLYRTRQWAEARSRLASILVLYPDDGPAKMLAKRIDEFEMHAPPEDWDGVYTSKTK